MTATSSVDDDDETSAEPLLVIQFASEVGTGGGGSLDRLLRKRLRLLMTYCKHLHTSWLCSVDCLHTLANRWEGISASLWSDLPEGRASVKCWRSALPVFLLWELQKASDWGGAERWRWPSLMGSISRFVESHVHAHTHACMWLHHTIELQYSPISVRIHQAQLNKGWDAAASCSDRTPLWVELCQIDSDYMV